MKNIVYVLAIIFTLNVAAQEGTEHTNRHERKEMKAKMKKGRKFMKDLTPEQIAELKTKKLTLALDLSDDQQQRVLALNTEMAKAKKEKIAAHKVKMEKKEKPTSDEKYAMMNDHLNAMIAYKKSMKQILSQEQYERWEKMQARKGKKKHKRREEHK